MLASASPREILSVCFVSKKLTSCSGVIKTQL